MLDTAEENRNYTINVRKGLIMCFLFCFFEVRMARVYILMFDFLNEFLFNFIFVHLVFDPTRPITNPFCRRGTNVDYRIIAISASSKLIANAEQMWQQRLKPIWYQKPTF